jgi:hypothetical protein
MPKAGTRFNRCPPNPKACRDENFILGWVYGVAQSNTCRDENFMRHLFDGLGQGWSSSLYSGCPEPGPILAPGAFRGGGVRTLLRTPLRGIDSRPDSVRISGVQRGLRNARRGRFRVAMCARPRTCTLVCATMGLPHRCLGPPVLRSAGGPFLSDPEIDTTLTPRRRSFSGPVEGVQGTTPRGAAVEPWRCQEAVMAAACSWLLPSSGPRKIAAEGRSSNG